MRQRRRQTLFERRFDRRDALEVRISMCELALEVERDSHGLSGRKHPRRRELEKTLARHALHEWHHATRTPRPFDAADAARIIPRLFDRPEHPEMTVRVGDWHLTRRDGADGATWLTVARAGRDVLRYAVRPDGSIIGRHLHVETDDLVPASILVGHLEAHRPVSPVLEEISRVTPDDVARWCRIDPLTRRLVVGDHAAGDKSDTRTFRTDCPVIGILLDAQHYAAQDVCLPDTPTWRFAAEWLHGVGFAVYLVTPGNEGEVTS